MEDTTCPVERRITTITKSLGLVLEKYNSLVLRLAHSMSSFNLSVLWPVQDEEQLEQLAVSIEVHHGGRSHQGLIEVSVRQQETKADSFVYDEVDATKLGVGRKRRSRRRRRREQDVVTWLYQETFLNRDLG